MRIFVFIFLLIGKLMAYSTTFVPVTIKDQLVEAQGILKGEVVSVNAEKDEELGIVSRVFIKADKWMRLPVENGHIEVYFPGGSLGDESQIAHGAPKFKPGEKVIVLTKSHKGKHWVQNLGLGKFSIKKAGTEEVMVNDIFPTLPNVGQMPVKVFYKLAENVKNKEFKERFKDKYERAAEKQARLNPFREDSLKSKSRGRGLASAHPSKKVERSSPLWLVFFFGALGIGFRFLKRRKSE